MAYAGDRLLTMSEDLYRRARGTALESLAAEVARAAERNHIERKAIVNMAQLGYISPRTRRWVDIVTASDGETSGAA